MNPVLRNTLSVFLGLIGAFLCGLILWPLVQIIFDKFFRGYFGSPRWEDAWVNRLIIIITAMVWLLFSSITGGIVCSLIAVTKEWVFVIISVIIVLLVLTIISKGEIFYRPETESLLSILMIPMGFGIGLLIGIKIKARRQKKKIPEIEFESTSSPSDTNNQSL